jgi:uncharacterized membrane protein
LSEVVDETLCERSSLCIRPLLRRAYGIFWDHALLLIAAHVVVVLVLLLGNQLLRMGGHMLIGPFLLGFYKISLRLARNEETEFSDLLSGFEYFLPAFVANILIHLMAVLTFPLLVVPGLAVLLTYSTCYLFILEENLGFWDAMEASRRLVWGNLRRWAVVGLVVVLLNLAGALCLLVGLLVSLPFGHLLITLAYEEERQTRRAAAPE